MLGLPPVLISWGRGWIFVQGGYAVATGAAIRTWHRRWMGKSGIRATTLYAVRPAQGLPLVLIGRGHGGMVVPVHGEGATAVATRTWHPG